MTFFVFLNVCEASSSSFMSGQAGTIRKGRGKVCKFSSFFVVAGTIRKRRVLFPKVVSTVPLFKKPMFLAPAARNNRFFFFGVLGSNGLKVRHFCPVADSFKQRRVWEPAETLTRHTFSKVLLAC